MCTETSGIKESNLLHLSAPESKRNQSGTLFIYEYESGKAQLLLALILIPCESEEHIHYPKGENDSC
jgi:hypothetical protein